MSTLYDEDDSKASEEQESQQSLVAVDLVPSASGSDTYQQLDEHTAPADVTKGTEIPDKKRGLFARITSDQITWLLTLAKNEIPILIIGVIGLLVSSALNLVIPSYIGKFIDTATQTDGSFTALIISLVVVLLVMSIFNGVRAFCFNISAERVVARLRRLLFDNLIIQEVAFFDTTKTGELLNRLSSDTKALENAVTVNISMAARFAVQAIGGVTVLFITSWKLSLVMIALIPPVVIGAVLYGRFVKSLSRKVQDALAASSDVAEESLSNVRTVRSFGQEAKHMQQYGAAIQNGYVIARKLTLVGASFQSVMMFLGSISLIFVLWFGGSLVKQGEMTIGTLTSFLIYTLFVAFALGILSSLWFDIIKALGATERVHELVKRIPAIDCRPGMGNIIGEDYFRGKIQFKDVNFSYPSRPDNQVLNNFNLTLNPGEVVALVGESGGGKSTVVSLLQRFYDPVSGGILIDDNKLTDLDVIWLRHNIGVVSQEPTLFACSIRDNIAYAKENASHEEVIAAAREANATQFISTFAENYETKVGERGVRLSGGQKQRIAIARALLKNPKILCLDEATSALDAESEHLVQQALDRLMKGRTVLVIAHRLSTVKNADRVCVVQNGRIIEQGKHAELLQRGGVYRNLVERQLLQSNEDKTEFEKSRK